MMNLNFHRISSIIKGREALNVPEPEDKHRLTDIQRRWIEEGQVVIRYVDPNDLVPIEGVNSGETHSAYDKKIESMIEHIETSGMFFPLVETAEDEDGSLIIVDGHHRVEAYIRMGLKEIPVLVSI